MRGADEAAGIIALGLFRLVVDDFGYVQARAHAGRAGEEGRINSRGIHHRDMLIEIVEQRMDGVARRAVLVVAEYPAGTRVFFDQLAWREVMLKIDNHGSLLVREKSFMPLPLRQIKGVAHLSKAA